MPCQPVPLACLLALTVVGSLRATELSAQPLDRFSGLRLRVGQAVRITGPGARQATGTISQLEERRLLLRMRDAGERIVLPEEVQELAVQRRYGWQGALVGAVVGLGITLATDCQDDEACDPDLPILLGASIGGLLGHGFKRYDVRFTLGGGSRMTER